MSAQPQRKPNKRYRVIYRDGAETVTTATSSLKAEQKAIRARPGIIKSVLFLKGQPT